MTPLPVLPSPPASPHRAARPVDPPPRAALWRSWGGWLAILIAVGGVTLRLVHWASFRGRGFDETLYAHYLGQMLKVGLTGYPDIVDAYLRVQAK